MLLVKIGIRFGSCVAAVDVAAIFGRISVVRSPVVRVIVPNTVPLPVLVMQKYYTLNMYNTNLVNVINYILMYFSPSPRLLLVVTTTMIHNCARSMFKRQHSGIN